MEIVTIVTLLFVALTFSRSHSLQLTVPNSDQSSIDSNTNSSNFIIDSSSSVPPLYNLPSSSSLSSFTSSSSSSSSMSSSSSSPHNLPFTSGHRVSSSLNPSDGTSNHHHSNVKPIVKLTGKSAFLRREMLKNTSVTCNDGTTAGYYIRHAANGSKKWLIYLEGGGHCFSRESCYQRWIAGRTLMSSAHWPMIRSMGGIFSLNENENPHWYHANHVLIPYCSSDSWSGNSYASNQGDFSFLGAKILQQVITELMPVGLKDANLLLLAGSSAGAVGVMVNLDRISNLVTSLGSTATVVGLADSGWFIDNVPFSMSNNDLYTSYTSPSTSSVSTSVAGHNLFGGHNNNDSTHTSRSRQQQQQQQANSIKLLCQKYPHACPPVEGIKLGYKYWNGLVSQNCYNQYTSEPWRCYFGYRIYPTLNTPIFIIQWIFDEAQMTFDNVAHPVTKAEWNYIHKLGQDLKRTFANVTALFAPSCVSHIVLTKKSWSETKVSGTSLPDALNCWEHQQLHQQQRQQSIVNQNGYTESTFSGSSLVGSSKGERHVATEPLAFSRTNEPTGPLLILQQQQQQQLQHAPILRSSMQQVTRVNQTFITNGHNQPSQQLPSTHTHVTLIEEKAGRRRKRKHRKHGRRHHHKVKVNGNSNSNKVHNKIHNNYNHRNNNNHNSNANGDNGASDTCKYKLIDNCSWPQCNRGCPRLINPFTGKEMDFIELFKTFGLDMAEVADAMGIDKLTLSRMDHESLLHLLTQ